MDLDELAQKIRGRIAKCRELAKYINDPRTTETLLQMANEGERDLAKLETEGAVPTSMIDRVSHTRSGDRIN